MLNINDVFYTIQGEGLNSGRASLFVRMPFCNLACPWCDTEFNSYNTWTPTEFRDEALKHYRRHSLAVITGGEPSMNKNSPDVIRILKEIGYEIAMESNGQFKAPSGVDYLTISPKRWKNRDVGDLSNPFWFDPQNEPAEIKMIVDGQDVLDAAKIIQANYERGSFRFKNDVARFYLSPEWTEREKFLPLIITFVQENPLWKISLQTHKILDVK